LWLPSTASTAGGFGVVWIRQLRPFQRSASVTPGCGASDGDHCPTAVQASGVGHETPPSRVPFAPPVPLGFGVDWISHVVPFQCSANVRKFNWLSTRRPTAVHERTAGRATPLKAT